MISLCVFGETDWSSFTKRKSCSLIIGRTVFAFPLYELYSSERSVHRQKTSETNERGDFISLLHSWMRCRRRVSWLGRHASSCTILPHSRSLPPLCKWRCFTTLRGAERATRRHFSRMCDTCRERDVERIFATQIGVCTRVIVRLNLHERPLGNLSLSLSWRKS